MRGVKAATERSFRLGVLALSLLAPVVLAAPPPDSAIRDPAITPAELRAHAGYLASKELAGRGTGTPGVARAARYLAHHFRRFGLQPKGDRGSYLQRFPFVAGVSLGEPNTATLAIAGRRVELRLNEDFVPIGFSRSGRAAGEIVFAGYGIRQPQLGYDDYAGVDVRGKILLILRGTPDGQDRGRFAPYAPIRYKLMTAREQGAAGVLLFSGTSGRPPDELLPLRGDGSSDSDLVALSVRRDVAERLLAAAGKRLEALEVAMAHGQPQSGAIPNARAEIMVTLRPDSRSCANVVGMLPGADPRLRHEYVVIGAHYDHLGMGGEHSLDPSGRAAIHYGADDNASGTAGVLELAQYFASRRARVRRSLLFVAFSGEEIGLLGSAWFVRHPPVPLERIVAMINLDMVGRSRGGQVHVIGVGSAAEWPALLERVNRRFGLTLRHGETGFGGSDHQSFYARNIPVLFFFTGLHEDYHRPSDTADKLNVRDQARLLGLVAGVVEEIARMPARPRFQRAPETAPTPSVTFNVYLGTVPDYSQHPEGVLLAGVREGSPAERGGLKAGDVIVEFGGRRVRNVQEYTFALRDAQPGVPVKVVVLRGGQRVELEVTPAARR